MIQQIKIEIINSLSISELDALRFMESNKALVLELSIHDLSKKIFVSTATIIRLAKKLGYSGYSELKYFIREELNVEKSNITDCSVEGFLEKQKKMFLETIEQMNISDYQKVVNFLLEGKKIHFFAKGLNTPIMEYASKLMSTVGIANMVYTDSHIAHLAAERMTEDDVLFLCSLTGNTHQVHRMGLIAKSKKAHIIALTANNKNHLYELADFNLNIISNPDQVRPKDIASRSSFVLIFDLLINLYVQQSNK